MKRCVSFLFVALAVEAAFGEFKGTGITTRYWDCCKPACAWRENVESVIPVASCAADGYTVLDPSAMSGCGEDGVSYVCNSNQPWAVNDTLAYGFAGVSFSGGADISKCCSCFKLTFIDALPAKSLIVQAVNTGADALLNQFDLQIPGGGIGVNSLGCATQWNAPWEGWGQRYGGVSTDEECDTLLPEELRPGCHFRFGWLEGADNPRVNFEQIVCPQEIVSVTSCAYDDF